ncbi:serine/threonine-protein kinase [Paludisphaera mucosa]|uniref:Protein kinase n=1 Tax=Paludisphaera mucosa TaxID=3030827 RepID=A0ABT6FJ86_9BACT|nr:serine/threonine-protein kinase [Paludisphaera mucosa]MDG3007641.1 protein kinase [Paludisphaera mucosa]
MDANRDLLFGLLAFQTGAIDADQLAETCAGLDAGRTQGAGAALAADGTLTDDQRAALERLVEERLERHAGDVQATLAATFDGRSLDVVRAAAPRAIAPAVAAAAASAAEEATLGAAGPAVGHVLISTIDKGAGHDEEGRDPRYTLTHLHAKGGMGQVWKARDGALGREIALKELRPESAGDSVVWSRFLYEAKVTARLEHPGVVPVYEMGGGESPYYTMRFVKGRTLGEATRAYHKARAAGTEDHVDLVNLLTAFVSVCNAIDYAHSRGIIHRDLKGQNVVLGDFGEVIVLDWGLAKQIGVDGQAGDAADVEAPPEPEAATLAGAPEDLATLAVDSPSRAEAAPDGLDATLAAGATAAAPPRPAASPADADSTLPPGAAPAHAARSGDSSKGSGAGAGSGSGGRGQGKESGAGPEGTIQGQLLGTPAYMAPEQARGRHDLIDFRTDVYGLGAILYELLAGQPPFLGKKTAEILYKVSHESPATVRSHNPQAPLDLQAVCLKALAKEREDRYQTAGELARDVQRHLADEPVTAYVEPWPRRAARWARKHKTAVAAATVLLLASTVASGVGTVVVNRWRDEAEAQGAIARGTVNDMYGRLGEGWLEDRLDPLQKDFMEKTVAFYEGQTGRAADDPAVQLEHGEMLRRMGNVYAKFGRRDDAEKAYRRGRDLLRPLVAARRSDPEPRRVLASTEIRFAEALFRQDRFDEAAALFASADDLIRPLATPDFATVEDRRLLARELRSKAQLLRRRGDLPATGPACIEARDLLEKALAAAPDSPEVVGELAQAEDYLARYRRETGESDKAEAASRRSYELLDKLVAEYPTIPRHREGLYHACAEMGRLAYEASRFDDAAILWGRGWNEASRLAGDYPDRPEYGLNLAAASTNYGGVLVELARLREAEPILRKAVELNTELASRTPDDRQVRFDLAKCRFNLGYLLLKRGRLDEAIAEIEKARDLNGTLVVELPDVPRNAHLQATYLSRLGEALDAAGRPGSEPAYDQALDLLRKLTDKHPANATYRLDLARCLSGLGHQKVAAGKPAEAEKDFEAALVQLDGLADKGARPSAEALRETSTVLSNLGSARQGLGKGDAEGPLRRAVAISEELARREPPAAEDLESLAVARVGLAESLQARGAAAEAAPLFAQAAEGMAGLVAKAPADPRLHYFLGYILAKQAATREKPEDARVGLEEAVAHVKQAVEATTGRNPSYRDLLTETLASLSDADLKLAAYEDARRVAMEIPRNAVAPAPSCLAAARLLARLASLARKDVKLNVAQRDDLERKGLAGAVLLLREALDADPGLEAEVKGDPAFKDLLAHAEYQLLLGSLAEPAGTRK